jgi:hypothetical protein
MPAEGREATAGFRGSASNTSLDVARIENR